jgi:hypothetical protein
MFPPILSSPRRRLLSGAGSGAAIQTKSWSALLIPSDAGTL